MRKDCWTARVLKVAIALVLPMIASSGPAEARVPSQLETAANPPQDVSAHTAVLTRYCVTCHNDSVKTGGLAIDAAELAHIADNAAVWENIVRKLRSVAMPPAGAPRPDAATYDSLASFLETELDKADAIRPNLGRLPPLYRLTRTEYQNAIRDLLLIEALPAEMDYSLLLPPDNAASGFDNIADLLFISPTAMERYLDAARKISRLAVGDPEAPMFVNIHRLSPELPQDSRMDDLPFGTRGGLAVRSHFPLDGEYVINVEMAGVGREPHQLEISIDGQRIELMSVGDTGSSNAAEFRIPVKAGPRTVGVAFVQHNEALDEATLRPRMRTRGTQPAVASATISGPHNVAGPGDTPTRDRIFVCRPGSNVDEMPCVRQILTNLIQRAYRRPATDADVEDLLPFYVAGRDETGFEFGIQKALERLLVSPQFLFRIERDPPGIAPHTVYHVSDLELASRLSFFLWSSIPDDELLDIAVRGNLRDPGMLEQQVRRMLADPRSESLVTNFAAQWLFLGDLELKEPDPLLFRDFDQSLSRAMKRETELFVDSILRGDRSVLDLLRANHTFLNERLAAHYGIPNVKGSHFRRVTFPEGTERGGLLGQGSILTITSYSTRTSPVLRGKYVLDNLLASPPPPPPPDIPGLTTESDERGLPVSVREATIQHLANPVCANCHARMDPIGFAMENFDAIGRWREIDDGQPIDVSGVLPDGTRFEGVAGLKAVLLSQPELFATAFTEKLLMYAIRRNVHYYDAPTVRAIIREAAQTGYTFSSLVLGVVKSAPFQMRESQGL